MPTPLLTPLATPARRWVLPEIASGAVERLRDELRLPAAFCRLLVKRGYGDAAEAKEYLRPHEGHLHRAGGMSGMSAAVERLARAIEAGETVLVHGDYDVDGVCTTALYVRALRMMGAKAEGFVPHRLRDGYDLSEAGIRAAQRAGAGLILTGDCGIVAHEAVERARKAGIDVIVTDHHTPSDELPGAVAVVNPNRVDCRYPNKGLAGVGVAYKVCEALAEERGFPGERLTCFLDLVAVATIADMAPLTPENRALTRWGLKVLGRTRNPGLRALLATTGLAKNEEVSAGQVSFVLAPRINAAGRMGDASRGVRLLLADDAGEAEKLASLLEGENRWRREVGERTFREAIEMLEASYDPTRDRGVVLAREGWHPGVIGIVASRIVERIFRPTVLIAVGHDEGKGSARSIPGFDLHGALACCADSLVRFGGHRAAAGCSILPDRIEGFRSAFDAHAREILGDTEPVPELNVDAELSLGEADIGLCRLLRHLGPHGPGSRAPIFVVRGVSWRGARIVGEKHLKMTLAAGGAKLDGIGFGMGPRLGELGSPPGHLDVAFRLEENSWRGASRAEAHLVDFRLSA